MTTSAIATAWSPYSEPYFDADERDVVASANVNTEPVEVTALREAAAHMGAVTCRRGTNSLDVHGPSPEVTRWAIANGGHPFHYECNDRRVASMEVEMCGVLVNFYIDERDAAWSVLPVVQPARIVGDAGEEDCA